MNITLLSTAKGNTIHLSYSKSKKLVQLRMHEEGNIKEFEVKKVFLKQNEPYLGSIVLIKILRI